jgi:predicted RND superfamily exporter protein
MCGTQCLVTDYITTFILERRRYLAAVVGLLTVAAVLPVSQVHFDNALELWFSDDDPELIIYEQFSQQFLADQIVVVGVFHEDIFDTISLSVVDRISTAAAELEHTYRVNSITRSVLAARLEHGFLDPQFRETVMASPVLNGTLVSSDGTGAAIVVHLARTGESAEVKGRFVAALNDIAERETDNTSVSFVLSGAPVIGKAGQAKNQRDMRVLVPVMVLIILALTFAVLRSIWLSLLPLTVVTIAVVWSFAFMGVADWQMTMLSAMLMPLILAVGVADTIHVVICFRQQIAAGQDRRGAVRNSLLRLLRPCFFTTITTVIGLLALLVSDIAPVRQFGVVAAIGVFAAFVISFTLVPTLLLIIPTADRDRASSTSSVLTALLIRVTGWSAQRPKTIVAVSLLLVVACSWSATRITVGVDPLTWFPADDPYRAATAKVDKAFGGSLSMEFLVSAPRGNLNSPAMLRRLDDFETWLVQNTDITRTISIVGVVKETTRIARDAGADGYSLPQSQFLTDAMLESIQRGGQLDDWVQGDFSSARISARIPVDRAQNVVQQTPAIRTLLQDKFADDELQIRMTGYAVLVGKMQDYVIRSQIESFSVALLVIGILMFLLMRSAALGLLSLIPNLIPLLVGLGAMAYFGVALNPGTVMVTAVALGIVVDDTVHFMTAISRELCNTSDIAVAINRAVADIGRPIVVTSLLLTVGFSVLLLGSFMPSRQIGGITALIIVVALVADLLLVPAALRLLPTRLLTGRAA